VYIVLFPYPWDRTHFGVVLVLVGAACTLLSLWHCPELALSKRGPSAVLGLGQVCLQGGSSISKFGREYQQRLVPPAGVCVLMLGAMGGNGACQLLSSWRSPPVVSVPPGQALR